MRNLGFDSMIKSETNENLINYILDDNNIFYEVGYKVLQNQEKHGLIKCGKLFQNGKIKLIYGVGNYKPISALISQLNRQNYLLIVSRLYDIAKNTEKNGFIRCENIETDKNKIFINTDDLSVHLICLPINKISRHENIFVFYESLKETVLNLVELNPNLKNPDLLRIMDTAMKSMDGKKPIDISNKQEENNKPEQAEKQQAIRINDNKKTSSKKREGLFGPSSFRLFSRKKTTGNNANIKHSILLVSTNRDEEINILIDKPIFLIGKQMGAVDGVIANEKTISRVHCKISLEKGSFYIQDMKSTNGTYVNNSRIIDDQKIKINSDDIIKLSNIEFIVK